MELNLNELTELIDDSWKRQLKNAFKKPQELLAYLELEPQSTNKFFGTWLSSYQFRLFVTRFFADLMHKGDIHDPLLMQVLPFAGEEIKHPEFVPQPLEETDNFIPINNIVHKYQDRLLFMPKGSCAINCRYCFRRNFPYSDLKTSAADFAVSFDYIYAQGITEVILSGGDPLMMSDKEFISLAQNLLARNEQAQLQGRVEVKRLRIHTRLPIVLPERINSCFLATCRCLQQRGIQVIMVFHINHVQELSSEFKSKCLQLRNEQITMFNQAVLLRGINDSVAVLEQLCEALFAQGVIPYYLHLLDKVTGAVHFWVEDEAALQLYRELQRVLPGYMLPRLAREEVGKSSKTLMCVRS